MTTAHLSPESCRHPVLDLFQNLGYELDPIEVDLDEWSRAGFELPVSRTDSLVHAGRIDEVDILLLRSDDRGAPRAILETYRSFNRILRPLVAVGRTDLVELWGWAESGTIGRLDVPLDGPTHEVRRRIDLIANRPGRDLGARIEVALNRESVSGRFFRGFSGAVDSIADELETQSIAREDARSWAVLFLSRILFLFFIQEKEWLDGDRNFLVDRPVRGVSSGPILSSFFQPLFFECLNKRPSERTTIARRLGRIPYLNGGLFHPSRFEEAHSELTLSDALVRTIIDDVFARFPFTIREDDESLVAIDPEMLGHVFESLMEERERARSGSFYTPKPIVDHLAGRAVRTWLGSPPGDTIDLGAISEGERERMRDLLRKITILDPACGSGAFLLAAMKEVERIRIGLGEGLSPDRLRQEIVERSLFGVDLKPEAVQLCELRLWLAIVAVRPSGPEAIESVQPLPNLDRNILQGNTLLDPLSFQAGRRLSVHRLWLDSLRARTERLDAYRHAVGSRRQSLYRELVQSDLELGERLLEEAIRLERADLQAIESQERLFPGSGRRPETSLVACIANLEDELERLRRGELGFFSPDLHFSSVMEQGGFDLVVGNPPWVRGSNVSPALRSALRDRFEWIRPSGRCTAPPFPQFELSILFLEKAASIASRAGVVSMLLPAKILKAFYAERCRTELTTNHSVIAIDDWSRRDGLFRADTFPIGLTFTPGPSDSSVEIVRDGERWTTDDHLQIAPEAEGWSLVPPPVARALRSIWVNHRSLSTVLGRDPVMGVKTGANRVYFLEEAALDQSGLTTTEGALIPWSALTRCIRGRDVRRWKAEDSTWMLWPEEPGDPTWKREFASTRGMSSAELRLSYVRPEHLGWKVVWKDVATRIEAVVVPDSVEVLGQRVPLLPNQTLYCVDSASIDETYLISAILNSSLMTLVARAIAEPAKDGHYRFFGRTMARLPWPEVRPDHEIGRQLIRLARAGHAGADPQAELDLLICDLYGIETDVLETLARWI